MPSFTNTGPRSENTPSRTTSASPTEQRPAELGEQPAQAEAAVLARLAIQVDRGAVLYRREGGHPGQQLRRRVPGCAASRRHRRHPAQPGSEAGRAVDRLPDRRPARGDRDGVAVAVSLRGPGGLPRRFGHAELGQRLDGIADGFGVLLLEARQQGPVQRAASRCSSSWVPLSTTRPPSSTAMRSARWSVDRRWATSRVVRPAMTRRSPSWMAASTRASTALVASSRTRIRGSARMARARAIRWRWPPDSVSPRSPTTVS